MGIILILFGIFIEMPYWLSVITIVVGVLSTVVNVVSIVAKVISGDYN